MRPQTIRPILTALALALALPVAAQAQGVGNGGCPPGLAKKSPACVPPGQARARAGYDVGDRYDGDWRIVDSTRYGLPPLAEGEAYVRVGDRILRVNRTERIVLDILALAAN